MRGELGNDVGAQVGLVIKAVEGSLAFEQASSYTINVLLILKPLHVVHQHKLYMRDLSYEYETNQESIYVTRYSSHNLLDPFISHRFGAGGC